jgi:hypothetical protein
MHYDSVVIGRFRRVEGVMCFHELFAKILQKHLMAFEVMSTSYVTGIVNLL